MSDNRDHVQSKGSKRCLALIAVVGVALLNATLGLSQTGQAERVRKPFTPFKIINNIYYVGDAGVAVYLITTPAGHILLDTGWAETVPIIKAGVERLGFQMRDIKIMISGHAHVDHVAGLALVKEMTGARVLASEPDAMVIERGGARGDDRGPGTHRWTPAKVDQLIRDGEKVILGGVALVAHMTPGHTRGNMTWTTVIEEGGRKLNVVFMASIGVRREQLVNNPNYPDIVADCQRTFRLLKTLPCDAFLGSHGDKFDLNGKFARMQAGAKENPFIDPVGCRQFVEREEASFFKQLEEERQTRK